MYISVAHDREGHIRIYLNDGSIYTRGRQPEDGSKELYQGDKVFCTDPLTTSSVTTYLQLIMTAIMAWDDPLQVTRWEVANGQNRPATPRNAVGFNSTHREVWALKYDKDGNKRFAELLETGSRGTIATTFVIALSKLFLMDLEATLEHQKGMTFDQLNKKEKKNV